MDEVIEKLKDIKDLDLEICGSWLWVSGKTKDNKDLLKSLGLFYAPKKQQWYFRPAGYKSRRHKPVSMDRIRDTYGSEVLV